MHAGGVPSALATCTSSPWLRPQAVPANTATTSPEGAALQGMVKVQLMAGGPAARGGGGAGVAAPPLLPNLYDVLVKAQVLTPALEHVPVVDPVLVARGEAVPGYEHWAKTFAFSAKASITQRGKPYAFLKGSREYSFFQEDPPGDFHSSRWPASNF
eukprot:CAMPEP_0179035098 /NCGR_PEP_ID=MMETSP0796-20121207/12940_1 /TAXON_ID=73915 /ORGANISM="Pyrodinium bahamense, Strain pbaha01" /LENGTH=156 /DNA_ID=CAMNT_0020731369 /DNA_START=1 /DNA_END=474 /DNA_ORIENTATION=+